MKTLAIKGTKDFLPYEEELRSNIRNIIENTYNDDSNKHDMLHASHSLHPKEHSIFS